MTQNLYLFYCGGKAEGARIEMYDVIIAVGEDVKYCYPQIQQKWFGKKEKLHIDGYILIDGLEGYRVELQPKSDQLFKPEKKLYFVNLGGTVKGDLYEHHEGILTIAGSNMGAMSRARSLSKGGYEDKHVDNILDVDDLISIGDELEEYEINLIPDRQFENHSPAVENVYWFVK